MAYSTLYGAISDVQACEERLVNLWPSHQTLVVGDWLCRFAMGYSGRANSACLVRQGAHLDPGALKHIEHLYNQAGLRPSFRLTPLANESIRMVLEARGYRPEDASIGMIGPAVKADIPDALHLAPSPDTAWLDGACRWQTGAKRDAGALKGIVGNIRLPARFATLHHAGKPAAYGFIALDRGMAEFGSVMVDPDLRGQGLGRILVSGMMAWAAHAGAERIFMQVATENDIARGLYRDLGFSDVYASVYWRKN